MKYFIKEVIQTFKERDIGLINSIFKSALLRNPKIFSFVESQHKFQGTSFPDTVNDQRRIKNTTMLKTRFALKY